MVEALAVYKTMEVLVIKYQTENPKNQRNFLIWSLSHDVDSFFYLAIKNIYPALIIGFASRFTIIPNQKLNTTAFSKLFV